MFEELMNYKKTVFRICLGFSRDPWEAEDLAQEVYLKAYLKLDSLEHPELKKEWLFRIAHNTCLDYLKKHRRQRRHGREKVSSLTPGDEPVERKTPESLMALDQQLKRLKGAIIQLPGKLRDVFVLKEYAHMSYREIAAALGIKEGTVTSRLNRARQRVIEKMREDERR